MTPTPDPVLLSDDPNQDVDGIPFARVVRTRHGPIEAITAVHEQRWSRRIGGARFVEHGTLSEVAHLSSCMTDKCAAAHLPADGEKTLVVCPEGVPPSIEERARVLAEHVEILRRIDPGVIVGPDMNVPEAVQDRVSRVSGLLDHVTGLSEAGGGLGIDAHGYTAKGLAVALAELTDAGVLAPGRVSIQGFGAVGAHLARALAEAGWSIVAVSDIGGAWVAEAGGRLDVDGLFARWQAQGRIAGAAAPGAAWHDDPNVLFSVPTDVFVPAARTTVLAREDELKWARFENSHVLPIERFLAEVRPRVILEGANHPLSEAAEMYASHARVICLPDFAVNLGGLVGCWAEWAWRGELLRGDADTRRRLSGLCERWVRNAVRSNVRDLLRRDCDPRTAARAMARDAAARLAARVGPLQHGDGGRAIARRLLDEARPEL
jgi:glutamate dehydrogenase/leucine dehydrogenase